MQIEYNDSFGV